MKIGTIEGATRNLGAPENWDQNNISCDDLPIQDVTVGGVNTMGSAWIPDREERERIAYGAPIILWVWGTAHPPVSVAVGTPDYSVEPQAVKEIVSRLRTVARALVREQKIYAEDIETLSDVLQFLESLPARLEAERAAVPDGWVVVPREPTEEMIRCGWGADTSLQDANVQRVWKTMLSAAPTLAGKENW